MTALEYRKEENYYNGQTAWHVTLEEDPDYQVGMIVESNQGGFWCYSGGESMSGSDRFAMEDTLEAAQRKCKRYFL